VAVACALVGGIAVWAPGHGMASGPAPGSSSAPLPTAGTTSPTGTAQPPPGESVTTPSGQGPLEPTTAHVTAADLGTGWTGPVGTPAERQVLTITGSACEQHIQEKPVRPAWSLTFDEYSSSGTRTNIFMESVFVFAPGQGPGAMATVRAAIAAGCGSGSGLVPLTPPSAAGDEAILYDLGSSQEILVRSGDRVAFALVEITPSGAAGSAWTARLARAMGSRLTGG
jgi:hypothetical protein